MFIFRLLSLFNQWFLSHSLRYIDAQKGDTVTGRRLPTGGRLKLKVYEGTILDFDELHTAQKGQDEVNTQGKRNSTTKWTGKKHAAGSN